MTDPGGKKSQPLLIKMWRRLRQRRLVREGEQEEVSPVKGQSFLATAPRCPPGFTGPLIVGVVWKKEFLCSGDRNEMECGNNVVEGSVSGTVTPGRSGFTGPVIVGVTWKQQNISCCTGHCHEEQQVHGHKKISKWKKIWRWITNRVK